MALTAAVLSAKFIESKRGKKSVGYSREEIFEKEVVNIFFPFADSNLKDLFSAAGIYCKSDCKNNLK